MADIDSAPSRRSPTLRLVGASPAARRKAVADPRSDKRPKKGHYYYPKALLRQAYFCLGGTGTWFEPKLSLDMVSNPKFVSPIKALLDQLEREGHDVTGALIEWMTYREQVAKLCADFEQIGLEFGFKFAALGRSHAVLAGALYSDPRKGGPAPNP